MKFNERVEEVLEMKLIGDVMYATILLGGSIGGKSIRSVKDIKGNKIGKYEKLYEDRNEAKASAKDSNSRLSKGEKSYYGLKYVVAEVLNGIFTGK